MLGQDTVLTPQKTGNSYQYTTFFYLHKCSINVPLNFKIHCFFCCSFCCWLLLGGICWIVSVACRRNHTQPQQPGASSCWSPAWSRTIVGWHPILWYKCARPSWSHKSSVGLRLGCLVGPLILSTTKFWKSVSGKPCSDWLSREARTSDLFHLVQLFWEDTKVSPHKIGTDSPPLDRSTRFILPSRVNMIPRYLKCLTPNPKKEFYPFPIENRGLRFGGVDYFCHCLTFGCEAHQLELKSPMQWLQQTISFAKSRD